MDSIEQLREIYWNLDIPLRRRIEAAAICIQYQGFGEAFDFLKRVGSEPEAAPSLRILALKYTAQYESRRKPPPPPMTRESALSGIGNRLDAATRARLRIIEAPAVAND